MMNIVIVGAGDVGRYIASILSQEEHNIILIDNNPKKLDKASSSMDVATRLGSGTDWQMLDELLETSPDFFIALTGDDETNLVSCNIAKHLGYPHTIARVRDNRFLNRTRLDFAHTFDVDYFIGPELLVANDIMKYITSPGSLAIENFAHGAVQMRTFVIPQNWRKKDTPLSELNLPKEMMIGLIYRQEPVKKGAKKPEPKKVIFPHGNEKILPGDEITFIGETEEIVNIHQFFGIQQGIIKSAVIAGGSLTGRNLARLLEKRDIDVRIIDKDYERCSAMADALPYCTIMNHDATDLNFLRSEKIGNAEIFISCTRVDETNLMTALLAKEVGCQDVLMVLTNTGYTPLISRLGINHTLSPVVSTANHILSQILAGKVSTMVSLYDNQAEIMEIEVSMNSKVVGIPIFKLGPLLPKDFLITMIQNRGRIMVANGSRIISPGDSVIAITNPKHISELEAIF